MKCYFAHKVLIIFILLFFCLDIVHANSQWKCEFKLPDNEKGQKMLVSIMGLNNKKSGADICNGFNCTIYWKILENKVIPTSQNLENTELNFLGVPPMFTFQINDYTWNNEVTALYNYTKINPTNHSRTLGGSQKVYLNKPFFNWVYNFKTDGYNITIFITPFELTEQDIKKTYFPDYFGVKNKYHEIYGLEYTSLASEIRRLIAKLKGGGAWYITLVRIKSDEKNLDILTFHGKDSNCEIIPNDVSKG